MPPFIDKHAEGRILAAIRKAEGLTSGEIRVHLQRQASGDPYRLATKKFEQFGMTRTAQRNGVLFYIVIKQRKFAVVGDAGIHEKVGDAFWTAVAAAMTEHFQKDDLVGGVEAGVLKAGEALAAHFPRKPDDINELPDELSVG